MIDWFTAVNSSVTVCVLTLTTKYYWKNSVLHFCLEYKEDQAYLSNFLLTYFDI